MPKISVIVPIYQTPMLKLLRCISSILNQTFQDFELLLIDDGNSDEYISEIDKYLDYEKDERIHWVHQKNQGVSIARNKGIEMSKGEYISFVDSDDYVKCSFLEQLLRGMESADLSICSVGGTQQSVQNNWCDRRFFFSKPTLFNGLQYINYPVNKLYKRSIINAHHIRFEAGVKLGEDAYFLSQYYSYCNNIQMIEDYLYIYDLNTDSATHRFEKNYWNWEQNVIDYQWKLFHQYPLNSVENEAMLVWLFRKFNGALNYYAENVRSKEELMALLKQITHNPYFRELCKLSSKTKYLEKSEIHHLWIWKKFGLNGVVLGIKIHLWKLRMRKYNLFNTVANQKRKSAQS